MIKKKTKLKKKKRKRMVWNFIVIYLISIGILLCIFYTLLFLFWKPMNIYKSIFFFILCIGTFIIIEGIVNRLVFRSYFYYHIIEAISDCSKISSSLSISSSILDFGSGNKNTLSLHFPSWNISSIDILPNIYKIPRYIQYDGKVTKLFSLFPTKIDIVVCSFVLHHLKKQKELLLTLQQISDYLLVLEDIPEKSIVPFLSKKTCISHFSFFNQDGEYYYENKVKTEQQWEDMLSPLATMIYKKYLHGHICYGFVPHILWIWKWKENK